MKLGFIGLGIMGKPMAKNLMKAGHDLVIYDINDNAVQELADFGAKKGSSSKDVAIQTEIIFTMLPNSPHVLEVILGENGVLEGASPDSIIVDMSSIAPLISKDIAKECEKKSIEFIDAPVSGGEPKAKNGSLAIMAGGKPEIYKKVEDLLLIMGSSAVLVGEVGSGNVTKLANQIIVAVNIAGLSEAMVLAENAGVDPERVYNAIRGGLAGSTVMDAKMPLILDRNFKPGFRMELHIKDLTNVIETAHTIDSPIFLTSQVIEMMKALRVDGKGKDDHGGLIQYYENLSKKIISRKDK